MELIKGLSESGEYNRIVVVGHSLGSVMAYEVLRLLWEQKFCGVFASPYPLQSALDELEAEAAAMYTTPSKIDIENFQDKQAALWREIRQRGNPWLVTDLITIGSPLAHAQFLLQGDGPF